MKTKYIIGIITAFIIILIVYKLTVNKREIDRKNTQTDSTVVRIPVRTAVVEEQLQEISIVKTGNITPFKETKVFSVTGGTIEKLYIDLGDRVKQGQVIARIDTRSQQLDLQNARSKVAKLRNDLNTYTELLAGKAATQEQVNGIRQDYLDAVNQLNKVKKQIADASVKAPTSGVIATKAAEEGIFVNGGAEIATVVNLSQVKVHVNLTEAEVYQVKQGQRVRITADVYPGREFDGTIRFISPQADQTHNYMVEIEVDNTSQSLLRSGTFVYADFSKKTQQQVLLIPREALTESVKNASVYVVENNVAHLKAVQTGNESGSKVQIIRGLQKGEVIVTSGQINLRDGAPVSISK